MATYVVYRHGSNAANQHLCQTMPVGMVDAPSRAAAVDRAQDELRVTVYNNQHLSAVAWSRVPRGDREAVLEADAIDNEVLAPEQVGCVLAAGGQPHR